MERRIFFYQRNPGSSISPFSLRAKFLSHWTAHPPAQLEDLSFLLSIVHPEDKETFLRLLDALQSGKCFEYEYRLIAQDGKEVWLRDFSWPGENPGEIRGLLEECSERKQSECLKDFHQRIAEAAAFLEDIQDFYSSLHQALRKLMYAENFYICLWEPKNNMLTFPFFKDQHTPSAPARSPRKGLTEFVLRGGETLLLTGREDYEKLISSEEVERLGEPPESWLGVPLKEGRETIGVIVVQSYDPRFHFDEQDRDLLLQLSNHVMTAINRMRQKEELKKTKEQLSLLIDFCPDLIFYKDTEGKYIRVNPAFEDCFALSKEAIIGKTDSDIMPPESAELCGRSDSAALKEKGPVKSEEVLRAADGSLRYFDLTKMAIRDERGIPTGIIAYAHEITQRKLAEEKLSALLRFQEQMLETPLIHINVVDPEGNITFWNKGAELLSGYTKEEVLHSQKIWQWLYPDPQYRKKQIDLVLEVSKTTEADLETTIRRKDGELRNISWYGSKMEGPNGEFLGSIFIGVDTTERKRAEESLRASEEKYRNLVENMMDVVFTLTPEGEITYVSPTAEKLIGYHPAQLVQRNVFEFVDPEYHSFLKDKFRQRLAGEKVTPYELLLLRADGGKVPVAINSAALKDMEGKIVGILGTARDISERKRLEDEVQKARTDALSSITHEMKAPLMNIAAALELTKGLIPGLGKDQLAEYSDALERNLSRLRRLIENVLDSQRAMGTGFKLFLAPVDLKLLLLKVIQQNSIYARTHRIRFSLDLKDLPPMKLDAEAIERLLENIITNAIKFSPIDEEVKITLAKKGSVARVIVHNHGPAIPPKEIENLFQPFQRTSESQKSRTVGTGLGLYVAKLIAEAHGGKIFLESEASKGTQITLCLPFLPEATSSAKSSE